VLTDDVADLAIGLAIALLRRIREADRHVREGRWPEGEVLLARKASAQRFGILGLGHIGKAIARRLEGFGVPIAYTDLAPQDVPYSFHPTPTALAHAVDVLIVAAAAGMRHLIDHAVLDALGPAGMLVNVARGSLVDEAALVAALQEGRLDVFAAEPNVPEPLWAMPNVALIPHVASATIDTLRAMAELVLANLDAHFAGQPLPTAVG
jgi:lactate dehydrogenase-like 2-hydroxyacid dehydrogenase